jgi:membrane protein
VAGYLTFLLLLALFPYLVLMVSASRAGRAGRNRGEISLLSCWQHLPADAAPPCPADRTKSLSGPPQSMLTFSILGAIWTSSSAIEGIAACSTAPTACLRASLFDRAASRSICRPDFILTC